MAEQGERQYSLLQTRGTETFYPFGNVLSELKGLSIPSFRRFRILLT